MSSINANIDSLKIAAERSDTLGVIAKFELGKKFIGSNLDTCLQLMKASLKQSKELDYTHGRIINYRALGALVYRADGDFEESEDWLKKGLKLIDEKKLGPGEKVDMLTNLGIVYYNWDKVGKAIEVYLEAAQTCRKANLTEKQSRLLNNIGVFYRKIKEYDKAVAVYEEAYAVRKENKDTLGMANTLLNMSATYGKLKNNEKSILVLDEALQWYTHLGRKEDILECKVAKGMILYDLDKSEEALQELKPLVNTKPYALSGTPLFRTMITLAQIHRDREEYQLALNYLNKIDPESMESGLGEEFTAFHKIKSQAYAALGNNKLAYSNLLKSNEAQSEFNKASNLELKEEMVAKYEAVEKDYRIELLNKEKSISELKIKSQRSRNIFLGIGLGVMSLIAFLLYNLYQKLSTNNELLRKSEHQKSVLLKEIHHRVKNNLQVISSLLSLQATKVTDDTTKEALRTSKSRVQSMSLLHQNLYNRENLTSVNVEEYISNLTENLLDMYKVDMEVGMNLDIDPVELDVDSLIPIGLIINEIVCNAIKYAFDETPNAEISVQFKEQDSNNFLLNIKDNGIGLPDGQLKSNKNSLGTKLIESFVEKLDGTLSVRNSDGAEFGIVIPKESLVLS